MLIERVCWPTSVSEGPCQGAVVAREDVLVERVYLEGVLRGCMLAESIC